MTRSVDKISGGRKRTRVHIATIGELNVDRVASGLTTAPQMGREILADDFQITLGDQLRLDDLSGNDRFARYERVQVGTAEKAHVTSTSSTRSKRTN